MREKNIATFLIIILFIVLIYAGYVFLTKFTNTLNKDIGSPYQEYSSELKNLK